MNAVQARFVDGPVAPVTRKLMPPIPDQVWFVLVGAYYELVAERPDAAVRALEYRRSFGPIDGEATYGYVAK